MAVLTVAVAGCGGDDGTSSTSDTASPMAAAASLDVPGVVTLQGADDGDAAAGIATGDFNGDGEVDVLLAAAFADGPEDQREDAGEVLVFLGPFEPGETRDSAAGDRDAVIYGADAGDQAGRAVATADVNGDGTDDIVVGVPFGAGAENDLPGAGEVAVVFGSRDLGESRVEVDLALEPDVLVLGPAEGALMGFSLSTGNLNGDGAGDIVIGSFQADGRDGAAETGLVDVVYGSTDLPAILDRSSEAADATVYGPSEGAWLGESVSTGDFDGDGLDDLLLSATFALTLAGEEDGGRVAVVLSPLAPELDLSNEDADYVIYGADSGDQIGHSSAAGDVDGDGLDDALLGAVSADGVDNATNLAGEAALVLGRSMEPTIDVAAGAQDVAIYGPADTDRLGRSVALGDVDGDGLADLVLGAPGTDADDPPAADAGALYVIRGGSSVGSPIDLAEDARVFFGLAAGDELTNGVEGRPALAVADMNGDGRGEILVTSSNAGARTGAGVAYILYVASL